LVGYKPSVIDFYDKNESKEGICYYRCCCGYCRFYARFL